MISIVSAISILAYLLALIMFRKTIVIQQFIFSIICLVSITAVGELDIVLPIYFVFSFLPFIKYLRRMSSFTFALLICTSVYLLYGMAFQNLSRAIATFIAKIWQFNIFFLVYDSKVDIEDNKWDWLLWLSLITESVLGVYLLRTQTRIDSLTGLVRLGNNGQPITGNISTIAIILLVYLYTLNKGDKKRTTRMLWVSMGYLIWIVLSGTRGYMLEYVATMFFVFFDYFTNNEVGGVTQRKRILTMMFLGISAFIVAIVVPGVIDRIFTLFRVKASVGIRTYENAAAKEFFLNAPIYVEIFGIGIGGTASSYSAMAEALGRQFSLGMWSRNYYLTNSGALFHNLYANILMNMGIVGIVGIIAVFFQMWKRVTRSCKASTLECKCYHLFLISFFLMNYYRWSAVCGITEMIVLALMLRKMETNTKFVQRII